MLTWPCQVLEKHYTNMKKPSPSLVSVHGGHSGQFCNHALDSLEEIVIEYIGQGFSWVGITEHSPAISEELLYPDEKKAGLSPESQLKNFTRYISECRRLQDKYRSSITIFTAMEIETYSGYEKFVPFLLEKFRPDYIVGSVHFVGDIGFDYSLEFYNLAVTKAGSVDNLYCNYFDAQFEMIKSLKPAVVGHFDLIRIYDPEYLERLERPAIVQKITRNLRLIKEMDLILDLNLRALLKGAKEPYVSHSILKMAREMNIAVVPGDDSHSKNSVGTNLNKGVEILQNLDFSTDWQQPKLLVY